MSMLMMPKSYLVAQVKKQHQEKQHKRCLFISSNPREKRAVKQLNRVLRQSCWFPGDESKSESSHRAYSLKVGLFTRLLLVLINCKTSHWACRFYWRVDSCISRPFKLELRDVPLGSLCVAVICVPLHFIGTALFFSTRRLVLHNLLPQTLE